MTKDSNIGIHNNFVPFISINGNLYFKFINDFNMELQNKWNEVINKIESMERPEICSGTSICIPIFNGETGEMIFWTILGKVGIFFEETNLQFSDHESEILLGITYMYCHGPVKAGNFAIPSLEAFGAITENDIVDNRNFGLILEDGNNSIVRVFIIRFFSETYWILKYINFFKITFEQFFQHLQNNFKEIYYQFLLDLITIID